MRTQLAVVVLGTLVTSLAVTSLASAKAPIRLDDDDDEIIPMPLDEKPPPVTAGAIATDEDYDRPDRDDLAHHWRLEGGFGWRFGSFMVNGMSTGTAMPGHLDVGFRKGRLLLNTEYQLLSLELPANARIGASSRGAEGEIANLTSRGLVHRLGANARYSFGRVGEHDGGADVFVEGGLGLQHFRWDAGGVWTRPSISMGIGAAMFGVGEHKHGGFSVGLRIDLARRDDNANAPIACGGPCDMATKPTGWDRSFLFDMTVMFGK